VSGADCQRCQALERELGELARSLAHDLGAPVRAVGAFAALLEERYRDLLDTTGREYLRYVRAGAREAAQQIEALTRLALVSAAPLRPAPVSLDAVAREILAALAPADREIAIQAGLVACGDPTLLRRLLECLLDNAVRFTAGRAGARIEVGRHPNGSAFFVRDNGVGFDLRHADRLFRPFARLHPGRPEDRPGIGLAIARRIVERHGGTITAQGEEGRGATITFTLPSNPGFTSP
jgi:signal transduction histidine kinase